jgi:hypothetical protein
MSGEYTRCLNIQKIFATSRIFSKGKPEVFHHQAEAFD